MSNESSNEHAGTGLEVVAGCGERHRGVAGLILASSDPRAVVSIIRLSKAAYRKSLQNLWWAAGYNILAIPIAAGALGWAGFTMPPAVAAILMSVSTIVVEANAQLLRRVELRPPGTRRTGTPANHRGGAVMTKAADAPLDTTDRKVLAALAACCVGPMLLIIVLTSALGVAIGPAAAITLGLVAVGLCIAVMVQHHRRHRP